MKRIIYRLSDEGPAAEGWLDYGDDYLIEKMVIAGEAIADAPGTLEELADLCDRHAGNRNNHEFVGAHRILAAILHQQLGRDAATKVMRAVAEYGGLDYASGCGIGRDETLAAWGDFGLQEPEHDWTLPE